MFVCGVTVSQSTVPREARAHTLEKRLPTNKCRRGKKDRQTERQKERQKEMESERQTDRQTDRQTERKRERKGERHRHVLDVCKGKKDANDFSNAY